MEHAEARTSSVEAVQPEVRTIFVERVVTVQQAIDLLSVQYPWFGMENAVKISAAKRQEMKNLLAGLGIGLEGSLSRNERYVIVQGTSHRAPVDDPPAFRSVPQAAVA